MKTKPRRIKNARQRYLTVAIGLSVVVLSFTLLRSAFASLSVPPQIANLESCGIYPKTSLFQGAATAAITTPLTLLTQSSLGTAAGPPFQSDGLPTLHSDNSSARVSLYQASNSGARTIVVTASNVGTRPLNITSLIVFGMTKTTGFAYSTVYFGRVIDPSTNDIGATKCQGPLAASTSPIVLLPGQSITGTMAGSGSVNGVQVSGFSPTLIYYPVGNPTLRYIISPEVTWIT